MSEEDLEILITVDDPGEEDLQVDTFDHSHVPKTQSKGDENPEE